MGAKDLSGRREDFHFKHWQFFADLAPVTNCPVLLPALELGADQPEIALCCLAALGFSPKEPMLELAHFALECSDLPIFFLKPFQRFFVHALVIVGIPAAPDRLLSQCLIFLAEPDILAKQPCHIGRGKVSRRWLLRVGNFCQWCLGGLQSLLTLPDGF